MELDNWCKILRENLNNLSELTSKSIPLSINPMLQECTAATSDLANVDIDIKIAIVGAFSSGKSSFLNAVLDRDLTAVDINRTTRCRTDFTYGEQFKIINIRSGMELNENDYKTASRTGQAQTESHYRITLPDLRLKNIVIVDTPGFDPPPDSDVDKEHQDAEISKRAAQDADICLFLLVAKDGTLQGHCLDYLKELNERTLENAENPLRLVIVLNQADLKMPSARDKILANVIDICRKNQINAEKFLLHTAKKSQKNPDFYLTCQEDIWKLIHEFQQQKNLIASVKKSAAARLSRQTLFDLQSVLEQFVEFQIEHIEKQQLKSGQKNETVSKNAIEDIAEQIKELVCDFARINRWSYSSNYQVDDSGIFGWDWTKDWKAYITDNDRKVLPADGSRDELKQQLDKILKGYAIPSVDVYSERFLTDIDNFILSLFHEKDGNGYYKRCGISHICPTVSVADEQSKKWQNEYLYELSERADEYFCSHVGAALESLLKSENGKEELMLKNDLSICCNIKRLIFKEFPSLQDKNSFQHPVLDNKHQIQKKYVALLEFCKHFLDSESSKMLVEFAKKITMLGDLDFSTEQLEEMSKQDAAAILAREDNENCADFLLTYLLTDVGFYTCLPENEKLLFNAVKSINLFNEINCDEYTGIFQFGSLAKTARDLQHFIDLVKDCSYYPNKWAYLLINRGFSGEDCKHLEAAVEKMSWLDISNSFAQKDFTFSSDNSLLLESCLFPSFDRYAAEFLLKNGCDINAEHDGENAAQSLWMSLSDEAFEFLLEKGIKISDQTWSNLFMMNKTSLIEVAMRCNQQIPPEALFNPFMKLETIRAYGDNGGNLNLYSEEMQTTLIDSFVHCDKNEIVEYLRSKGLTPSDDAKSMTQLCDELKKIFG